MSSAMPVTHRVAKLDALYGMVLKRIRVVPPRAAGKKWCIEFLTKTPVQALVSQKVEYFGGVDGNLFGVYYIAGKNLRSAERQLGDVSESLCHYLETRG